MYIYLYFVALSITGPGSNDMPVAMTISGTHVLIDMSKGHRRQSDGAFPLAKPRTIRTSKYITVNDYNLLNKLRIHDFILIQINMWVKGKACPYSRMPTKLEKNHHLALTTIITDGESSMDDETLGSKSDE